MKKKRIGRSDEIVISIDFYGTTNRPYVMVNTMMIAENSCGNQLTIDRDTTWYNSEDLEDGIFSVTWEEPYVWDGTEARYLTEDDIEMLRDFRFVDLELEDDADADYEVYLTDVVVFSGNGEEVTLLETR